MPASTSPAVRASAVARGAWAALAALAATVSALSISICAAALELLWQGMLIASRHISRFDLLSALLIGLVLAFLVDPLMERIRSVLSRDRPPETASVANDRNPLFSTCIGIVFAFVSVCLHSALASFVSGPEGHAGADLAVLEAAVRLTAEWALVPFFITLAWICACRWWAKVPFGIVAATSPLFAGWLFSWAWQSVVITAVPCVAILLLGYRQAFNEPRQSGFAPYARTVAFVAAIWLAATALVEVVLYSLSIDRPQFCDFLEFWIDARFYLGWALGLLITPFPFHIGPDGSAAARHR
jgi:hypothetical protein